MGFWEDLGPGNIALLFLKYCFFKNILNLFLLMNNLGDVTTMLPKVGLKTKMFCTVNLNHN